MKKSFKDRQTALRDKRLSLRKDVDLFIAECGEAYQCGTLSDVQRLVANYPAILNEVETLDLGFAEEHFCNEIAKFIHPASDDPQKLSLIMQAFPGCHSDVTIGNLHHNPVNARLFLLAKLKQSYSVQRLYHDIDVAFSVVRSGANAPLFVEVVDQLMETVRFNFSDYRSGFVIDQMLKSLMKTLPALHAIEGELRQSVNERACLLADYIAAGNEKNEYSHVALTALLDGPFRDAGMRIYQGLYMYDDSTDVHLQLHRKYGLSYDNNRMKHYVSPVGKKAGAPLKCAMMARIKVHLGHTDDYSFLFDGFHLSADWLRQAVDESSQGHLDARVSLARGVLQCIDNFAEDHHRIIDVLREMPDGAAALDQLRGSRETSRKMLEVELAL